jgi:hypothetical protein
MNLGLVGEQHDSTAARTDLADELVLPDDAPLHASIIASESVGKGQCKELHLD